MNIWMWKTYKSLYSEVEPSFLINSVMLMVLQAALWCTDTCLLFVLFLICFWVQVATPKILDGDMLSQFLELTSKQQEAILSLPLSFLDTKSSSKLSPSSPIPVNQVVQLLERVHYALNWFHSVSWISGSQAQETEVFNQVWTYG